jgi:Zn-dependent protease with chaperone function
MDFFGYQDQAHRSTRKLIVLFVLAVAAIIVSIYIASVQLFIPPQGFEGPKDLRFISLINNLNLSRPPGVSIEEWLIYRDWWYPEFFLSLTVIITALILGGIIFKNNRLHRGGRAIASMLGGRPIRPDTADPDERRLLNIVEEMAIASGTPVPETYLMEQEPGINAFAAGFSREDMVIGVTKGSLDLLTRDELQGVMAHEFSHILRGDMRLNMRLMGTVFGITMISMAGYFILRFTSRSFRTNTFIGGSRKKSGGSLVLGILIFGVLLYVIGYIGVFFGNLIKSAIARQREFLADASAVQFTRNPTGLAGALKKIGGLAHGSRILSPNAHEASHFYFCNGLRSGFFQMLATHPPLAERIRRLDPAFMGEFPEIEAPESGRMEQPDTVSSLAGDQLPSPKAEPVAVHPHQLVSNVGTLTADQIDYAANLRKNLPGQLLGALRDPVGASAIVLALLFSREESVRASQIQEIRQNTPPAVFDEISKLTPLVRSLGPEFRIPLVDWAAPALRNLSDRQYEQFRALTETLIAADRQTDLFEFCLQRMLRRCLDAHFHGAKSPSVKYFKTEDILPEALNLLSALAWTGQQSKTEASAAFSAGISQLNLSRRNDYTLEPKSDSVDLNRIDRALERLSLAGPYVKKNLLFSCAHVAASDGQLLEPERELLRAIADSLDLPVPPFIRELR